MIADTTGTVIIGAGPAGLAVAACLRRADAPFIVLEEGDSVGSRWRSRYERLRLHTAKEYSGLPYLPFPKHLPRYPLRDHVVAYLELYRNHFGIDPHFGERVTSLARDDGGWVVATDRTTTYRARNVVICTGRSDLPYRPRWAGEDTFTGSVIHSAEYRSGRPFAGRRVLVVGLGNSGGEIAIDLVEHGAAAVAIAVRSPVNIVPRDFLGQPIQRSTILLSFLPVVFRDRTGRIISRVVFGDLHALGLPRADEGPVSQILNRGRIPLIDIGTVALVRAGKIALRANVERFAGDRVRFVDGVEEGFDAVILATGYRAGASALVANFGVATDRGGSPDRFADAPGLYFVGFKTPPTGHLRQIAIDAKRVAREIDGRPS